MMSFKKYVNESSLIDLIKKPTKLEEKTREQEQEEKEGHRLYSPQEVMRMSTRMTNIQRGTTFKDRKSAREHEKMMKRGVAIQQRRTQDIQNIPTPSDLDQATRQRLQDTKHKVRKLTDTKRIRDHKFSSIINTIKGQGDLFSKHRKG